MENLSEKELIEIGGRHSSGAMSISSSSDSVLSLTFEKSYGSHYSKTEISTGNNVSIDLGLNAARF